MQFIDYSFMVYVLGFLLKISRVEFLTVNLPSSIFRLLEEIRKYNRYRYDFVRFIALFNILPYLLFYLFYIYILSSLLEANIIQCLPSIRLLHFRE